MNEHRRPLCYCARAVASLRLVAAPQLHQRRPMTKELRDVHDGHVHVTALETVTTIVSTMTLARCKYTLD